MKMKISVFFVTGLIFLISCQKMETDYDLNGNPAKGNNKYPSQTFNQASSHGMNSHMLMNFRAHLTGDAEVHDVETMATGQAIFQLSKDGLELHYKLIVANLENVSMSHIHLAPEGVNGPVVAWLYPAGPPPQVIEGTTNGILMEGIVTGDDLVGKLSGMELSALVDSIKAGKTYVNVHTDQYPAGELRGQIWGN